MFLIDTQICCWENIRTMNSILNRYSPLCDGYEAIVSLIITLVQHLYTVQYHNAFVMLQSQKRVHRLRF